MSQKKFKIEVNIGTKRFPDWRLIERPFRYEYEARDFATGKGFRDHLLDSFGVDQATSYRVVKDVKG